MNALTSFSSTPVVQSLGWTLLHFLWQGCLIAGILAVVLRVLRHRNGNRALFGDLRRPRGADATLAANRYAASCLAMLLMAVVPGVTFVLLAGSPAGWFTGTEAPRAVVIAASGETHQQTVITTALPYVVATWLLGVVLLLVRLTGGWCQVQRLKREMLCKSDGGWQETVDRLSQRLGLRSMVRIVESAAASVPTVIGWIRPIILMPFAAASGLSSEQLEVVIAHELAHIRRHDYLVNLLQSVMETLLFYHPGVWWVSGRMREEREYCCDDMAVAVCGDPIRYARVLTDLETLRGTTLHLGLSSTGGSLMNRVTRLVGLRAARPRRGSLWILTAFAMTAAAGVASVAGHSLIGASDDADAPKTVMVKLDLQTVGEEGEGHFVWVTPTSDTSEVEAQGVWVMNETVDGESHGVWVTTQTVEGEATVQTKAVARWMLTSRADETVVEFVDEEEESGGLSLLTLAYRYLSRVVADDRGDEQNNTLIGRVELQDADDVAGFGEETGTFTFEVEEGEFRVPHLLRAYVQFGELHLITDELEITLEPTVETGQLIEVRPVISEDRKGILLEVVPIIDRVEGEETAHFGRLELKADAMEIELPPVGELELNADTLDIEVQPVEEFAFDADTRNVEVHVTVDTLRLIRLPVIESDEVGRLIELHVETTHEASEDGVEPVTATLESRALGYWLSERGDGQGVDEEGVRVHLRTVRQVSLLRHYLSTIAVRPMLETTAEYHVLREIYDDAKEGDQVKLKVIIEIKEDESGDQ